MLNEQDVYDCKKYQSKLNFDHMNMSDHLMNLRVFYTWLGIRSDLNDQIKFSIQNNKGGSKKFSNKVSTTG